MSSIYYSAAWTECGCLISCWHEHKTVLEAASCIPCAGGYVVGVENSALRSLTAEEEVEFESALRNHPIANTAAKSTPASTQAAVSDSSYAVMTRVGDRWTWTTWMRFETYAEAAAHAREDNKVVRFGSPEWAALRQQTEAASAIVINAPRESIPPRSEGETLLEFVLRFLSAYGFAQHAEPFSGKPVPDVKNGLINTDMIDLVLSSLSELEVCELERMYAEDKHALLEAPGNRFHAVINPKNVGR